MTTARASKNADATRPAAAKPQPSLQEQWRGPLLRPLILVFTIIAIYLPSLHGQMILDDKLTITGNLIKHHLPPVWQLLTPAHDGGPVDGRPVTYATIALNYALGGQEMAGYHLLATLLHFSNCLLLMAVVRRSLELPGSPPAFARHSVTLGFVVTLLWGIHPLTAAAVDYVSQRSELCMALCYLLLFYCVIRSSSAVNHGGWWQVGAVTAAFVGMACKEEMVTAPLLVLCFDRIFLTSSWRKIFRQRGWMYLGLAASWVLLAGLVSGSGTRTNSAGFVQGNSVGSYILTQLNAVVIYLKLQFWPAPLIFDYGAELITHIKDVWPQAVLVVALIVGTIALVITRPRLGFIAMAWFVILSPTTSILPIWTQTIAEHRAYLPCTLAMLGLVLATYQAGSAWLNNWDPRLGNTSRLAVGLWLGLILASSAVLTTLTVLRHRNYRNELAAWDDVVHKRPLNVRAWYNRGNAHAQLHEYQLAVNDFNRAAELKETDAEIHTNRGNTYNILGRYDLAMLDLNRAIELDSKNADAYTDRGNTYTKLGKLQLALDDYTKAIECQPDTEDTAARFSNRGNIYRLLGQHEKALADFKRALELDEGYVNAYINRGNTYAQMGKLDEALVDFNQAIELDPNNFSAVGSRGNVYLARKDYPRALADFSRVIELKPDMADAYGIRGSAFAASGQYEQAISDFSHVLLIAPQNVQALQSRAAAFTMLKRYDEAWADVVQIRAKGAQPSAQLLKLLTEGSGRTK